MCTDGIKDFGVRALTPRTDTSLEAAGSAMRAMLAPRDGWLVPETVLSRARSEGVVRFGAEAVPVRVVVTKALAPGQWAVTRYDAARERYVLALCPESFAEALAGVPRSLWTIAHELAHLHLHRQEMREMHRLAYVGDACMCVWREERQWSCEYQANRAASAALMPAADVAGRDVAEVMSRFRVSEVAARRRMAEVEALCVRAADGSPCSGCT